MQLLKDFLFEALIGAVLGWGLCARFYFWTVRSRYGIGFDWVNAPLPETFWRRSGRFALVGAFVGLVYVAAKVFLYPHMHHWSLVQ
jgi:hypothetical protein